MKAYHRARILGVALAMLAAAGPARADDVRMEGGRILGALPIAFVAGGSTLAPGGDAAVAALAAFMEQKSYLTLVRVEAHVDGDSPGDFGLDMTKARALAVTRALVQKGIACARLLPVGFGASKPVADNGTVEGKAQNRRVEFAPATVRGIAIGGMPVDGGGVVAGDPCAG